MSLTNVVLFLVAVAVASAEQQDITDVCTGQPHYKVFMNETFMIMSNCTEASTVAYTFTIDGEMNSAFRVQLKSGNGTINRAGVTLIIDQTVYKNGTGNTFLTCTNGAGATCAPIYTTAGVMTYTWRAMTVHLTTPDQTNNTHGPMMTEILVSPFSTDSQMDVDLSKDDKSQTVMPVKYENTRQLVKMTAKSKDTANTYVNKFTVKADNCYLGETAGNATFAMYDSTGANGGMGKVTQSYTCVQKDTDFTGVVWLEYKREGVDFDKPTVTGTTTTTATKINGATQSSLSLLAVVAVIVYQMMIKPF